MVFLFLLLTVFSDLWSDKKRNPKSLICQQNQNQFWIWLYPKFRLMFWKCMQISTDLIRLCLTFIFKHNISRKFVKHNNCLNVLWIIIWEKYIFTLLTCSVLPWGCFNNPKNLSKCANLIFWSKFSLIIFVPAWESVSHISVTFVTSFCLSSVFLFSLLFASWWMQMFVVC